MSQNQCSGKCSRLCLGVCREIMTYAPSLFFSSMRKMLQLKVRVSTELESRRPPERYVLGREVIDHPSGGVVLLHEQRSMRYPNLEQTGLSFSWAWPPSLCFELTNSRVEVRDHRSERDNEQLNDLAPFRPLINLQSIPPCKLKAQTNVLRPSGSSVGCDQRTVFPSGESFRCDATSSPNSMCASL